MDCRAFTAGVLDYERETTMDEVLAGPGVPARAADPEPIYVTSVNPQQSKGMSVFARIAIELDRRRPDIPLLVVEGRGRAGSLEMLPAELSGLRNLNCMINTPDPRDFYRVSRAVNPGGPILS